MQRVILVIASVLTIAALIPSSEQIAWGQGDPKSIDGTVINNDGQKPEAGVWVIAETKDLPTDFRKIVVTDDAGRFVVPDLPKANYDVGFAATA